MKFSAWPEPRGLMALPNSLKKHSMFGPLQLGPFSADDSRAPTNNEHLSVDNDTYEKRFYDWSLFDCLLCYLTVPSSSFPSRSRQSFPTFINSSLDRQLLFFVLNDKWTFLAYVFLRIVCPSVLVFHNEPMMAPSLLRLASDSALFRASQVHPNQVRLQSVSPLI